MRYRSRPVGALSLIAVSVAAVPLTASAIEPPEARVSIAVTGLRSARGQVLACLTTNPRDFPDCRHDGAARRLAVPAGEGAILDFGAIAPGRYAISLLHDENGNGRADMVLMVPREGFGFSRDAAARFGPPRFASAAFEVGGDEVRQTIRMRYIF